MERSMSMPALSDPIIAPGGNLPPKRGSLVGSPGILNRKRATMFTGECTIEMSSLESPPKVPMSHGCDGTCTDFTEKVMQQPEQRYFQFCEQSGINVKIVKSLVTPSPKVDLAGLSLRDQDLDSLKESLLKEQPTSKGNKVP